MKLRVATLAAVCIMASVAVSNAAEVKDGNNNTGGGFEPAGDCNTDTDNRWFGDGGCMPDADPNGLLLGPVATEDDGTTFESVVLGIDMFHTWVGDLRMQLFYDTDCDGAPEIGPIAAMCRPGLAGCPADDCCGCSDDVDGSYLYSDSGAVSHEAACGPGFQGSGCYALDPASENPLAVLDGVAKGGCFWLLAADGAGGDTGCVLSWSVMANKGGGGTPIDEKSWTELKGAF